MHFNADLYERYEDEFGENEQVYESLLNLSQDGAGFQTQMAIGMSLSEVTIILSGNAVQINSNRWRKRCPVFAMSQLKSSLYLVEARAVLGSWRQR